MSSGESTRCDGVFAVVVPFVRKGLIEGVYGSSVRDVPRSEALQEMMEKLSMRPRLMKERHLQLYTVGTNRYAFSRAGRIDDQIRGRRGPSASQRGSFNQLGQPL